jgi:hypothetical protein
MYRGAVRRIGVIVTNFETPGHANEVRTSRLAKELPSA